MSDDLVAFLRARLDVDEHWVRALRTRGEDSLATRAAREVEAKRAILAEHAPGRDRCDEHDAEMRTVPCPTLLALAAIYSDHPHYRPTWSTANGTKRKD